MTVLLSLGTFLLITLGGGLAVVKSTAQTSTTLADFER